MSVGDAKKAARAAARARRYAAQSDGRNTAALAHLTHSLRPYRGAALAGYLPIRSEADPRPVMAAHVGACGVPIVLGKAKPLEFRVWTPATRLLEGAFGVMVPEDDVPLVPRVLIVPMLAFDERGYRLGYGGGFYDRTLEALRQRGPVTAIGLAFAAQLADDLPIEATDQPLDMIVTEDGVLATGAQPA